MDNYAQLWTKLSALQHRRVQVRFLSHLPREPEVMGGTAPWTQHNVRALAPI